MTLASSLSFTYYESFVDRYISINSLDNNKILISIGESSTVWELQ